MKLCAIVKQGKIVEVSLVDNNHKFGEHGDHYHFEGVYVDRLTCGGEAERLDPRREENR